MFETLRGGAFLTADRAKLWSVALIIGYLAALGSLYGGGHGLLDSSSRPLGTDFADVYTAGHAVLHGHAASPFIPAQHYRNEQALLGAKVPFYGWHYPPYFLFIAGGLATLPYIPSLVVWQLATLALYLGGIYWLLKKGPSPQLLSAPHWLLLALAFPAVFMNVTHGQNGFLTAALFAGALAACNGRPLLAGVLFGLMIYKPQFGLLMPLALVAESRWKTIFAAATTVTILTLLTLAVFGREVWEAFYQSLAFTRTAALEEGAAGYFKLQSVFAAVRMWGGPVPLAYFMQGLAALGVAFAVFRYWCSDATFARKAAVLCLGSFVVTPYCYDYDLMALAPAIGLLLSEGLAIGFRDYEKFAVGALWLMPFLARPVAQYTHFPLGVTVLLGTFVLLTRTEPAPKPRLAVPA